MDEDPPKPTKSTTVPGSPSRHSHFRSASSSAALSRVAASTSTSAPSLPVLASRQQFQAPFPPLSALASSSPNLLKHKHHHKHRDRDQNNESNTSSGQPSPPQLAALAPILPPSEQQNKHSVNEEPEKVVLSSRFNIVTQVILLLFHAQAL